ncbi:hypothetical protein ANN_12685 [Periplaneta americana]|uniref:Tc1-like transposase DDE domain-containing protein n=1 Tax=Periplaneta americana TaxID=6978 RepID=A0ABQ8TJF2_PERAM|nr:hypothetical protein ANN_12685 [Periplaneta americana]
MAGLCEGGNEPSGSLKAICIWCGIVGNQLLGPRVLPLQLKGEIYRAFLERELHCLLHDIPLATRVNLWFMLDGAPAHYCRNVRAFLNASYPDQRIGHADPTPWPARSPDINPLNFYLWGRLKSLVYASAVPNVEVLQHRIEHACGIVRRLALRNERWFESSWEKKFSHETSASVWDRCPPNIVMHLGSYNR